MYVADKTSIGRLGKLMSDFQVVRQVVRQINETVQFQNAKVAWIFPSATKLGTRNVTLKISQKWWMSSEQEYSLEYRLFVETYFHIMYILVQNKISQAMKKYYYEGPTFKL